ncbi:MAG: sn-glycerol-3-phosphate ABC transporter ATP-binding protein UgpC [Roseibium sp.]|nr:sn-glycerol-3-phosphate ABC transporter ATP-binding protein UgpC [Roseibium sp.]
MASVAGTKSALTWAVHISVALLVVLWLFPTIGLFVSSFRTADQISSSGWWAALLPSEQNEVYRAADPDDNRVADGDMFTVTGNIFDGSPREIRSWGVSSRDVSAFQPGETAEMKDGESVTLQPDGSYVWRGNDKQISGRGQRIFVTATVPPEFTRDNYQTILFSGTGQDNMAKAFFNTLTVTIPATIIPIVVAAFAAYALAWMEFPGRALLIAVVVALLVVPLQLALIPLLRLHLGIGIGKGYLGVWLAHTAFGMPLAVYLLRNYMVGLPRDIIENAKVDGATDFQIFTRIILPLSFPALASFAIFQFLWTWNDLLVAKVFLIDATGSTTVMTNQIVELLGTRGGNWEILATAAFVSIAVPLFVFFAMQRYLVRGLLAGSVKYGQVEVLRNINLEIQEGELIVFVGPSGCGKSTLLRMIAGLEKITGGTLEIDDQVVNDVPPAQRGIAMVFQSYALYPHMTVYDNMAFALRLAHQSKEEIDKAVRSAADTLQLTHLLDRLPKALSGGQRQRVAIGRAIVRDPKVFLFDEPLSNLDAALRVATRIEIAQLKESMPESTMIYVTHDQVEAMTLASRIVVLHGGDVEQFGEPLELYERPANTFVAQFIGSPAMNLIEAKVTATGEKTSVQMADGGHADAPIASIDSDMGTSVKLGVRPEDLEITESDDFLISAEVEIVEALGETTVLYFKSENGEPGLIAKLPGIHKIGRHTTIRMTAASEKLHLFDGNGKSFLYR